MSATGFHPDPSAKAPCTRTIVLTAAHAGDDAAIAAPARSARARRFALRLVVPVVIGCSPLAGVCQREYVESLPVRVLSSRAASGRFLRNVRRARPGADADRFRGNPG